MNATTTLIVPPGSTSPGASIVTGVGSPGTAATDAMTPAGTPVQIEVVGGTIIGQVTLQFVITPPTDPGDIPVIATWDGSAWQPQPSSFDPATSTLTLNTDHLSWWQPWTWHLGTVLKNTFNTFFGDVDSSELPCDAPNLTHGYEAELTNAGSAFSGCVTNDDDGLIITIKNRRRGAFSIELPAGWTGHVINAVHLSTAITEQVFNSTGRTFLIVPGGETAEIRGTIDPGVRVSMPVEQDLFSWSIDTLLFAGEVFTVVSGAAGASDTLSTVIQQSDHQISRLQDGLECLTGNEKWTQAANANPDSPDAANDLVPTIWSCAKALAKEGGVVKIISTIVELALTPFRQVYQLGEMAFDMLKGDSNRKLLIFRAASPTAPPCPDGVFDVSMTGSFDAGTVGQVDRIVAIEALDPDFENYVGALCRSDQLVGYALLHQSFLNGNSDPHDYLIDMQTVYPTATEWCANVPSWAQEAASTICQ